MMIEDILTHHGDWKVSENYNMLQKPAFFELSAIQNAIGDYIEEYKYRCLDNYMECIRGIKPSIGIYNIYGRIVHKKAKGCSHFYKTLAHMTKKMDWMAHAIEWKLILPILILTTSLIATASLAMSLK